MPNVTSIRTAGRLHRVTAVLITCVMCLLVGLVAAPRGEAYWVCGPNGPVVRQAQFRCMHGTYRPTISYIQKDSWQRAYGVYRSSGYGGGSVSGTEFYSSTSNYFLQNFHCNPGYPNAHNRHSIAITVQYTLAGSC